jgi:2-haloacid dehalogenase
MTSLLTDIRACVFDAYGTLFDVSSACRRHAAELDGRGNVLAARWRDKQLQYTWLRAAQGRHADFAQVTRDALEFALDELQLDRADLAQRLLEDYNRLDVYPEVPQVLAALADAAMPLAVLSNGTPPMLQALLSQGGLAGQFAHVISVEEVGAFKPARAVYARAVERLGVAAGYICFVSSNGWDAYAASAFGMRVAWCNRLGQLPERLPGRPDVQIQTLEELPALVVPGRVA